MGNCTGIFGGKSDADNDAIVKVDKDGMKHAIEKNQE